MKLRSRVKSRTAKQVQRRELRREHARELLFPDVVSGLRYAKLGGARNEAEFLRPNEPAYDHTK
jgi:hypothetical protein